MLVERMGGCIATENVVGAGAAFSLSFPSLGATSAQGPVARAVLHVDSDFETRSRVARWLKPLVQVESVANLALAREAVARQQPALCLCNPQDQGAADAFCREMQRLAAGRPVILYGDSVDEAFCTRAGLPWLSPARSGQEELLLAVQRALASPSAGMAGVGP
jgi:DNA-binding NtrC family response regulator